MSEDVERVLLGGLALFILFGTFGALGLALVVTQ